MEDIANLRAQGFTVDDDSEPIEENAGPAGPLPTGTWMRPTFCPRQSDGHTKVKGKWVGVPWPNVAEMDELELFLLCFPVKYLKETVIPQTNRHLTQQALTMQELFVFIGCILFMACHHVIEHQSDRWSIRPISAKEGAPF